MVATVTFDGTVIDSADNVANWTAIKITAGGAGPTAVAADAAYEGTNNVTCRSDNKRVYMYTDVGAGNEIDFTPLSTGTGAVKAPGQMFYIWTNFLASSLLNTRNLGGLGIFMESRTPSSSVYTLWYFYGSDNYNGGWKRLVLDPNKTASISNGGGVFDPGAVRYFGAFAETVATAKFDNFVIDQCARGKGIIVTGTSTVDALFSDLLSDETSNRRGVITSLNDSGTSIELNGGLVLGDTSATSSDLSDINSKIFLAEPQYYNGTAVVASVPIDFFGVSVVGGTGTNTINFGEPVGSAGGRNGISIVGNSTYNFNIDFSDGNVETNNWYGCSLENLTGTLSFDTAAHVFQGNTLSGCAGINFVNGSNPTGCTFVQSGLVDLNNSATLTNCIITESTATSSLQTSSLDNVSGSFTSDGSNHAVEITGIISTNTTMNWDASLSNYDAGSTGDPVTTTSTGNEAILCNVASGIKLTINVASGASIPSVRNTGTGTVAVVAGQVTLTVTVQDFANSSTKLENARVYVVAAAGGGLAEGTVIIDKALTDVNGQVSDTRSYSGNQPITGRVRYTNFPPYYKTANIVGTVSSTAGLNLTVQMIKDQ